MNNKHSDLTGFELSKLVTTSKMFSKVKLSPASKLVLRCIVDFWNPYLGYSFPKQTTIAECTGLTRISVTNIISELIDAKLITVNKNGTRLHYYFTDNFFSLIKPECKKFLPDMYQDFTFKGKKSLHVYNKKINNKIIKNSEKNPYPNIEQTRELLNSYTDIKHASPYDDYDCAVNWLSSLTPEALKIKQIKDKALEIAILWGIDFKIPE